MSVPRVSWSPSRGAFARATESEAGPQRADAGLRRGISDEHRWPVPGESLFRHFPRAIETKFRAVGECAARVVQDIDRPHREPGIALRIDVVECDPPRLVRVPDVDVLVH